MVTANGGRGAVLVMLAIAYVLLACMAVVASAAGGQHELRWMPTRSACGGTVGECIGDEEFELASTRRILQGGGTIGYGALTPNQVPCNNAGQSYYSNCQAGAPANPYSRGCQQINGCVS